MNRMRLRLNALLFSLILMLSVFGGLQFRDGRLTTASEANAAGSGSLPGAVWEDGNGAAGSSSASHKIELTKSKKKNKKKNKQKQTEQAAQNESAAQVGSSVTVTEDGTYTSKDEVAAYLHEFGHLPDNYITKKEAKKLGWVSSEGNLDEVAPGKSIGGDYFGNYEELLPVKKGRSYYECDIDFSGGRRGAKRIIFSDDGLIYYTEDHYQSFELLYGEE